MTMMIPALVFSAASMLNIWGLDSVHAQSNSSSNQTIAVDELTSNITQARDAAESGNSTAATMQLTAVIAELSDIIGTMTSEDGPYLDEHTHFFTHNDHTHTVTHKHPHHANHHNHEDWTDRHHIFNPKDCKPGLLC
jgi:hypothetical protein